MMNYQRIHDNIISKARTRGLTREDCPIEIHHIVPRCMGGTDTVDNLVALTPREHIIIHKLLYKIHRTGSMAYALTAMYMSNSRQGRPNTRQLAQARIDAAKYYSDNFSGVNHNWYGKKHTKATREKQRIAALGTTKNPYSVEKTAKTKRKPVVCTNMLTGEENILPGLRKAVELGFATDHTALGRACKGSQKTHNGYLWRYAG